MKLKQTNTSAHLVQKRFVTSCRKRITLLRCLSG